MVRNIGGVLYHFGKPSGGETQVGTRVELSVDADTRRLNATVHSAGHAIDVAIEAVLGPGCLKPHKGYHFTPGAYVEYWGALPGDMPKDRFMEMVSEGKMCA
ncbi:unnamed protein product [Discosporangium mesarthrocarpum]